MKTLLVIAGIVLAALWIGQSVLCLVGYNRYCREVKSSP